MKQTLMTAFEQDALLKERDELRRQVRELTERDKEAQQIVVMLVTVISTSIEIYKITKSPELLDTLIEKSQDFLKAINAKNKESA